jgi:hypothetical protein
VNASVGPTADAAHRIRYPPGVRTRASRIAVLALAAGSACPSPSRLSVEVPPDVAYVVLLQLDSDDVWRGHGPFRWQAGQGLPVLGRPDRPTRVLGYPASGIEPLLPAEDVSAQRLVPAGPCAPTLPEASWDVRLDDDGARMDPGAAPLRLTAPWLEARCADVAEVGVLTAVSCFGAWCGARVEAESRCRGRLDLSRCGLGPVPVATRPDGSLCIDPDALSAVACDPDVAVPPAGAALVCTVDDAPCGVELYTADPEPFVDVETRAIFEVPLHVPRNLAQYSHITPGALEDGYLHDLAVLDDRVFIAHSAGNFLASCDRDQERSPSVLERIDAETLATVATTTAPPCLRRLVADDGGFLGLFARNEGIWIGRFDADGRETAAAPLDARDPSTLDPEDLDFPFARHFRMVEVTRLDTGEIVAVVASGRDVDRTFVHMLRPGDFAPLRRRVLDGVEATTAFAGRDGLVVGALHTLYWLDPRTDDPSRSARIPERIVRNNVGIAAVMRDAPTAKVLAAAVIDVPQIQAFGEDGTVRRAAFVLDLAVQPSALAPWVEELVLVGGISRASQRDFPAMVARYDPRTERMLPGVARVGSGVVSRVARDSAGRRWLLLPWSAELARLTPR